MLGLAEHVANHGEIALVSVELDIFHSDIVRLVFLMKVRSLAVIGELVVNDVHVLDVQLTLTVHLLFLDHAKHFCMGVIRLNRLGQMFRRNSDNLV